MGRTVVLHGMHSSQNFGDVLLTQIMRDWLVTGAGAQVALLAPSPDVAQVLGLPAATRRQLWRSEAVILGGGGFFQRMDGPKGALKAIIKYGFPLGLARLFGKRTAMIGIGIAPMPRPGLDWLMARVLRRVDLVVVRDVVGYDHAADLLGSRTTDQLVQATDLIFSLTPDWLPQDARDWARAQHQALGTRRALVVHLSEPPSRTPRQDHIAGLLADRIKRQPDTGCLLIEDHPSNNGPQMQAQQEMATRLSGTPVRIIPYPGVERLAALLAGSDAVFTNKLHVGLCAAAMGTMPYALAKHRKNMASFSDLCLTQNCAMLTASDPSIFEPLLDSFAGCSSRLNIPDDVRTRATLAQRSVLEFFQ